jgi:hypothetical protein
MEGAINTLKHKTMNKVESFLPKLKASRYTYYNLDKDSVDDFKKLYSYLKRHKEKNVIWLHAKIAKDMLKERKGYTEFVWKYKAMEAIVQGIQH